MRPTVHTLPGIMAVVCVLGFAAPVIAHIVSDRDVQLIRSLPAARVRALLADATPDRDGLVGANHPVWRAIEPQAAAGFVLADAATRADTARAEAAWRCLDVAFVHQHPLGDFDRAVPMDALTSRLGTTRWTGETCRALVAVMNGPLQERFRWRHTLLLPKVRRTLDWLVAGADSVQAQLTAAKDGPALIVQARTFLLADGMFHEAVFGRAGQRAIQAALALQKADGMFASPYESVESQAESVWALQSITDYFPAPSLDAALKKAAIVLGAVASKRAAAGPEVTRRVALTLSLYAAYPLQGDLAKVAENLAAQAAPNPAPKPQHAPKRH